MATVPDSWTAWFRRTVAWSNTQQAWEERAGMLLLFAGAGALLVFSGTLSLAQQLLFWGAWLVALANRFITSLCSAGAGLRPRKSRNIS